METLTCICGCGVMANTYYKPFRPELNPTAYEAHDLIKLCYSPIFEAIPRFHLQFEFKDRGVSNSVTLINRYGNVIKVADFNNGGCPCAKERKPIT